jgi:hypothetical protein
LPWLYFAVFLDPATPVICAKFGGTVIEPSPRLKRCIGKATRGLNHDCVVAAFAHADGFMIDGALLRRSHQSGPIDVISKFKVVSNRSGSAKATSME